MLKLFYTINIQGRELQLGSFVKVGIVVVPTTTIFSSLNDLEVFT